MNGIESFGPVAATMRAGFFIAAPIGYVLKRVIKIVSIITGLFLD
jgi:uncharacterized membrane protein (Fun14 family)